MSVSDESVQDGRVQLELFDVVNFLAGEEKTTFLPKNDSTPVYRIFPERMMHLLGDYLEEGGKLFLSGAHIASDIHYHRQDSLVASLFKYKWRTSNASRLGEFYFMDQDFAEIDEPFTFNTGYHPEIYTVEGADALEPADSTATTLIRYTENNMSAAVAYQENYGIVALGFPFETIIGEKERDKIMKQILSFLMKQKEDE